MSTPLRCPHCLAPYPPGAFGRVTCAYCSTTTAFEAEGSVEGAGPVILRAELGRPKPAGWRDWTPTSYQRTFHLGPPDEMRVQFPPGSSKTTHVVLESGGVFDDVDVTATFRFLEGVGDASVGMQVRGSPSGSYSTSFNARGQFWAWYVDGNTLAAKVHSIVTAASQPALRTGQVVINQVRLVVRDDRLRLFHNGVLSMSTRHSALKTGTVKISCNPMGGPILFGVSDLVVREAK
jgi:hypothetical protein